MRRAGRIAGLGVVVALAACASVSPPPGWVARLSKAAPPPAGGCWPVPPAQAEQLLATGAGEIREHAPTPSGVTGAERLTVYFPAIRRSIRVKWKAAPPGQADGWNNTPRKELAAYAIQKWFLEPDGYVVPTAVGRCLPVDAYRRFEPKAQPTLSGTSCVFGIQSLWLDDVEPSETLYDPATFERDAAYARHLANFNMLAFLIDDRDTTPGNVLTSKDPSNRRVFSVDNGISFDPHLYNIFFDEWKDIRVPALPRASVDRLRRVTRERAAALGVVAQFRADTKGILRPVRPDPPIDPGRGSRFRDGTLQLGLTESEIDHVWERAQKLLAEVDSGRIPVF
jgi:hypothetical protein